MTSHYRFSSTKTDPIKIFDLSGNKIKEIKDSNEATVFIDRFFDKRFLKLFIITGNYKCIKSYDYEENCVHNIYNGKDHKYHDSIIVNDNEDIVKIIESSGDGNIRIWNFYTAELLKKIRFNKIGVYGICLWNNDYIFAGSKSSLKLINIKTEQVEKKLKGHNFEIVTIKKMIHPLYGECLVSQDRENTQIKIWSIDD